MEEWSWHTEWRKALGSVRDTDATETLALLGVGQGQAAGGHHKQISLFSHFMKLPQLPNENCLTLFSASF